MMRYDKYEREGALHWEWYRNDPVYKALVDQSLAPLLAEEGGTLVDIGCGDGLPLSFLAQKFKVTGVDDNQVGINLADHRVEATYFCEKAEEFAKRDLEFDYLFCLDAIEHLDDPTVMIRIMKKIKKFGIIATNDNDVNKSIGRYHNIEFTPATLRELFKDFNVEEVPIEDKTYFAYKISNK